jgi:Domain of unknown function (DUF4157)
MRTIKARRHRRPASRDMTTLQSGQREPLFFGQTAPAPFFQPAIAVRHAGIQRKCAACEGEEKVQRVPAKKEEEKLQRKESATASTVPTHAAANYIGSINGKGQPLSVRQQSFYGNRMGADFSRVKIHTGPEAAASAKDINAQAYAYGNHIVFNEGKYQPEASEGKHLLAHELNHVVQQGGAATQLQRQVVRPASAAAVPAAPVPHFRDCVRSITGRDDSDAILNAAVNRARDFVNTAIGLLANPPAAGTVYEQALALHFGSPIGAGARASLMRAFRRILHTLVVSNFICNTGRMCERPDQAFWTDSDDLIHVCPAFWGIADTTCQAIIIIHEAAHDAGIGIEDLNPATPQFDHRPNRGEREYPTAGAAPTGRISRSARADTPDAFAFFSAHVHTGADIAGNCFN